MDLIEEDNRTIKKIFCTTRNIDISAIPLLDLIPEEADKLRRELYRSRQIGKPLYLCSECKQPIKLSYKLIKEIHKGTNEPRHVRFFAHLQDSDVCKIKTKQESKRDTERKKYNGATESEKHFELKCKIRNYFKSTPSYSDVHPVTYIDKKTNEIKEKEKTIVDRYHTGDDLPERRRPDIYAKRNIDGQEFVLELQLSNTFMKVIIDREAFYKRHNIAMTWVFYRFDPKDPKATHMDTYLHNHSNVLVFDEAMSNQSLTQNNLCFDGHYKEYTRGKKGKIKASWKVKKVNFSDLKIDSNYVTYFHQPDPKLYAEYIQQENKKQVTELCRGYATEYKNHLKTLDIYSVSTEKAIENRTRKTISGFKTFFSDIYTSNTTDLKTIAKAKVGYNIWVNFLVDQNYFKTKEDFPLELLELLFIISKKNIPDAKKWGSIFENHKKNIILFKYMIQEYGTQKLKKAFKKKFTNQVLDQLLIDDDYYQEISYNRFIFKLFPKVRTSNYLTYISEINKVKDSLKEKITDDKVDYAIKILREYLATEKWSNVEENKLFFKIKERKKEVTVSCRVVNITAKRKSDNQQLAFLLAKGNNHNIKFEEDALFTSAATLCIPICFNTYSLDNITTIAMKNNPRNDYCIISKTSVMHYKETKDLYLFVNTNNYWKSKGGLVYKEEDTNPINLAVHEFKGKALGILLHAFEYDPTLVKAYDKQKDTKLSHADVLKLLKSTSPLYHAVVIGVKEKNTKNEKGVHLVIKLSVAINNKEFILKDYILVKHKTSEVAQNIGQQKVISLLNVTGTTSTDHLIDTECLVVLKEDDFSPEYVKVAKYLRPLED
jgi:hypothetical protein